MSEKLFAVKIGANKSPSLCSAFCSVTKGSSRIIYPHTRYITSNLQSQIAFDFINSLTHTLTHSHTKRHTHSLLCGPAGSPARLSGSVLQPEGGGLLAGWSDGWREARPGQSVCVCVCVCDCGVCLCVLAVCKHTLEIIFKGVKTCSVCQRSYEWNSVNVWLCALTYFPSAAKQPHISFSHAHTDTHTRTNTLSNPDNSTTLCFYYVA